MNRRNIIVLLVALMVVIGLVVLSQEKTASTGEVQGKIDINAVCEGALVYMSFPDGKSAENFVAECKEGKYPEVIEKFKKDLNIGEASLKSSANDSLEEGYKIYRDQNFGFQFEYPVGAEIKYLPNINKPESDPRLGTYSVSKTRAGEYVDAPTSFTVNEKDNNLDIEAWYNKYLEPWPAYGIIKNKFVTNNINILTAPVQGETEEESWVYVFDLGSYVLVVRQPLVKEGKDDGSSRFINSFKKI